MLRNLAYTLCLAALAACTTQPSDQPGKPAAVNLKMPPMKRFAATPSLPALRPNSQIANDFLSLSFEMESGRTLDRLTRFEGPIRVRVAPGAPATLDTDLDLLLRRLRREAGLNIARSTQTSPAQITIEAIPRQTLQRYVPQAACFVVPGVSSWSAYKRHRRTSRVDWAALTRRQDVAIFLPSDVSPQEVRDCLHEELAQSLGPLNDLYSLPDSVFNDDNFHTVLTGFDMLILRAYYAPELQNGMSRDQVAARLPAVLRRLNPKGERPGGGTTSNDTPRNWINAIETAFGPRTQDSRRLSAAKQAVSISDRMGWNDTRTGFSLIAQGRLALSTDPALSLASFLQAQRIYGASRLTRTQNAHVSMHLATFALATGRADGALSIVNGALPAATKAQNAELLATLLMLKAEALDVLGRPSEARAVRLDSLGWARYGFGTDKQVRRRLSEVAALAPRRQEQ